MKRVVRIPSLACALGLLVGTIAVAQDVGTPLPDGVHPMHRGLRELFERGGMMMWPILACSVVSLAFMIERAWSLRSRSIFPPGLNDEVRGLVAAGSLDEGMKRAEASRSPFGHLVAMCLIRAETEGFEMEAALEEAGARVLYDLRRNCRPLGVIADVSPLLGLMGTVIGMIKAFDVVANSGALGRTELLAEGIGEALITTAFGLGVAIPSILAYHYFRARADGLLRIMEDACIEILVAFRKRGGSV